MPRVHGCTRAAAFGVLSHTFHAINAQEGICPRAGHMPQVDGRHAMDAQERRRSECSTLSHLHNPTAARK
jgi:hypothetical protein